MQLKDKPYKTSLHTTSLRLDLREKVCRQQIKIGVKNMPGGMSTKTTG